MGANSYGQLGLGHREDRLCPSEVSVSGTLSASRPLTVTGGGGHTLLLTDEGSLWLSGSNSQGQLGQGSKRDEAVLTVGVFPSPVQITQVCGGWDFTLASSGEGQLYSWGSNAFHQLGRKTEEKCSTSPGRVNLPGGSKVIAVAAGLRHGLALTENSSVFGWGQNKKLQVGHLLGDDAKLLKSVTQPLKLDVSANGRPMSLTAGAYHSSLLTDSGEVILWGCNKFGQMSLDPSVTPQASTPHSLTHSVFGNGIIRQIASGWTHMLALTESGDVYSWGRADYGQLGRPAVGRVDHTPALVTGLTRVCRVACGSEHNLALTDDGKVMSWGWNEHGMCGTGDESDVPVPRQVELSAKRPNSIGCGAGHSFVITIR